MGTVRAFARVDRGWLVAAAAACALAVAAPARADVAPPAAAAAASGSAAAPSDSAAAAASGSAAAPSDSAVPAASGSAAAPATTAPRTSSRDPRSGELIEPCPPELVRWAEHASTGRTTIRPLSCPGKLVRMRVEDGAKTWDFEVREGSGFRPVAGTTWFVSPVGDFIWETADPSLHHSFDALSAAIAAAPKLDVPVAPLRPTANVAPIVMKKSQRGLVVAGAVAAAAVAVWLGIRSARRDGPPSPET
jgi:hypothetical protein